MAPMDITQFNALLHSKKDQSDWMSALRAITVIRNLEDLDEVGPMGQWAGWR